MKTLSYWKAKVVDLRNMIGKDRDHRRAETFARRKVKVLERAAGIIALCVLLCVLTGCFEGTGWFWHQVGDMFITK
jgi:hypothetical protein